MSFTAIGNMGGILPSPQRLLSVIRRVDLQESSTHGHLASHLIFKAMLPMLMSQHSSDPRNTTYGLLGRAGEVEAGAIQPDYSKTASSIFKQVPQSTSELRRTVSAQWEISTEYRRDRITHKILPSYILK
jgi:hypothetical protein